MALKSVWSRGRTVLRNLEMRCAKIFLLIIRKSSVAISVVSVDEFGAVILVVFVIMAFEEFGEVVLGNISLSFSIETAEGGVRLEVGLLAKNLS
jgi:hypothetical protein